MICFSFSWIHGYTFNSTIALVVVVVVVVLQPLFDGALILSKKYFSVSPL